jgi:hypothetical protein
MLVQCEQDDTDGDGSRHDSTGSANQTNPPNTKNPRTSSDFKFPRQSSPPEMEAARESVAALLDAGLFASAQTLVRAAIPVSPPLPTAFCSPRARISRVLPRIRRGSRARGRFGVQSVHPAWCSRGADRVAFAL